MSWPDLKKFSASLFDVNNCSIAGALKPENVSFEKIVGGDFSSIEVLVLLLNGKEWCVYARDAALESQFGRYGEA